LTLGRVAQAMGSILTAIATPARSSKHYEKSPGWKSGQSRQRKIRYLVVKKNYNQATQVTTRICLELLIFISEACLFPTQRSWIFFVA
jgi:hypothetical protein